MEAEGLHRGLELRLEALAGPITALRQKMSTNKGAEKIEDFGEIAALERRYDMLAERLQALNREGPGFRQDMKAEVEKVIDDLSGTVEDFMKWVDSDHRGNRPPTSRREPESFESGQDAGGQADSA